MGSSLSVAVLLLLLTTSHPCYNSVIMRRLVSGLTVLALVTGARCQMLDRNCFGEEDEGELTATFLASKNEEAQALVYSGERAFSVNLIKALFEKYENESIEENIFISPSSIYHTLMLA